MSARRSPVSSSALIAQLSQAVPQVPLRKDHATALMVIDMQYHDASPDHGFNLAVERIQPGAAAYFNEVNEALTVPTIQTLLEYFRAASLPVIHVITGSEYRDYRDMPSRWRAWTRHFEQAAGVPDILWSRSPGFAIRRELLPLEDELVVRKRSWSPFTDTHIDRLLREMHVENLVIVGVVTTGCIESTARDAADRGYACVLVANGTSDFSEGLRLGSLESLRVNIGSVVGSANNVIQAIETGIAV